MSSDEAATAVDDYRVDKAERVHIDSLTCPVALGKHWNIDGRAPEHWILVSGAVAAIRCCDTAFRYERAVRWVPGWNMRTIVELAVGSDIHIGAVEVEGYNAAVVTHIETAEASVCRQAAGETGMLHLNGYWESRHMDHPLDHLSPAREPLDMQRGCTELDTEPVSHLHSFEGCTVVSDPGAEAAIEHNSGDYTSAAVDTGQHRTTRRRSLAERRHCCSGMRLATAAPVRQHAAGCT